MIDLVSQKLFVAYADGSSATFPLYGAEAFPLLSEAWLKAGWAQKFSYNFSWMGRPIIQLPEDILMMQEVIYKVRPDVLIETGVAHGGSAVFFASLFEVFGHGRVISIDIEIRPHNRKALEEHPLMKRITLLEGSSISQMIFQAARDLIAPGEKVMVVLDSNHTKDHVHRELELYGALVASGSYLVVADGIMADLHEVPGGKPEWTQDNPRRAISEFLAVHPEFEIDHSPTRLGVTYCPGGFLLRK